MVDVGSAVVSGEDQLEEEEGDEAGEADHLNEDWKHVGVPELELSVSTRTHDHAAHETQPYRLDAELYISVTPGLRQALSNIYQIDQASLQSIFLHKEVPNIEYDDGIFGIEEEFV